jgi:hypothetical protein
MCEVPKVSRGYRKAMNASRRCNQAIFEEIFGLAGQETSALPANGSIERKH